MEAGPGGAARDGAGGTTVGGSATTTALAGQRGVLQSSASTSAWAAPPLPPSVMRKGKPRRPSWNSSSEDECQDDTGDGSPVRLCRGYGGAGRGRGCCRDGCSAGDDL